MFLAIDIGNTDTVVGIFDREKLISHFRVSSALNLTADEAGLFVSSLLKHHNQEKTIRIERIAICSVVPHLTEVYERMVRKYFNIEPFTVSWKSKLPFKIDYPEPSEIGADRLANAAAGFARFQKSVIVVDIGTATTFDIISKDGDYLGGIIAPGPKTTSAYLAQKAARLFEVRIEKPDRVIGKSTAEALKSGLYYGTVGMIDFLIEKIFAELGQATVIATGGEAETFKTGSKYITETIPTLTLEGIRLIADYASGK